MPRIRLPHGPQNRHDPVLVSLYSSLARNQMLLYGSESLFPKTWSVSAAVAQMMYRGEFRVPNDCVFRKEAIGSSPAAAHHPRLCHEFDLRGVSQSTQNAAFK